MKEVRCRALPSIMTDLSSRADIERLVDAFYARVQVDSRLGPIFNDVARVDWATHLPKMYAFWESVLFGASGFKGNPLAVHRALARHTELTPQDFDRWLHLFSETVDELFSGPVADDAKARAHRIATVMQFHIAADAAGKSALIP
jgi:hemoglobin